MSTRSRTLIALVAGAVFGFSAALTSGVLAEHPSDSDAACCGRQPSAALPWEEARLFAEVYRTDQA